MSGLLYSINGCRLTRLRVHKPYVGSWSAEGDFDSPLPANQLAGQAAVSVSGLTLSGTFDPLLTGTYLNVSKCHIHGGSGAWDKQVVRKSYHDDGTGVWARTVVQDLANEVGETLGGVTLPREFLGADWVRAAGPASTALSLVLAGTPWWVGDDGKTNIGPRPTSEIPVPYEILDVDPRFKTVEIACDQPAGIGIGSVLRGRLDNPIVIKDLCLVVEEGAFRMLAWGTEGGQVTNSRLLRDLYAVVRAAIPELPYCKPRQFVVVEANTGDHRWKLTPLAPGSDLDDISPASLAPGMAGLVADLKIGSSVLVVFAEGDPAQPMIVAHSPPDSADWLPTSATIDASGSVKVGPSAGAVELGSSEALTAVLDASDSVKVGPSAGIVELGSGSEPLSAVQAHGRVVRYGDPILFGAPGPGTIELNVAGLVSKVSA